jgi:16S rRNA (uracil1498-N3)-methyltransferase
VESFLKITLAQGIARGDRMDTIVQKAVELGVFDIMPLLTERCNVRLSGEREEKRLMHWQQIAVSACEQSGRNEVPMVHAPESYHSWLSSTHHEYGFVLSPHVSDRLQMVSLPKTARISLLIGPEGGLTDNEVATAIAKGFKPLSLGPRILRTETATLAALTAIQVTFGDM